MKKIIIYSLILIAVFINVTALIIYLNSRYQSIFEFDFRPKELVIENDSTFSDKTIPEIKEMIKQEILDSIAVEKARLDSIKKAHDEKEAKTRKNNKKANANFVDLDAKNAEKAARKARAKAKYEEWKKKTASVFEQMNPGKAAKILEKYSDNTARDILYSMNKKKAAKVLAALDPEIANKITLGK